jgi:hypothetical protein
MKVLWVDDWRTPPDGFECDIARTYFEAVSLLEKTDYDTIYLDHDLGLYSWKDDREYSGYDLVLWLVERKQEGKVVPRTYEYLTANPIGRERMKGTIERYLLV